VIFYRVVGVAGGVVGEGEQVVDAGAPDVGAQQVAGAVEVGGDLVSVVNEQVCCSSFDAGGATVQNVVFVEDIHRLRGFHGFQAVAFVPAQFHFDIRDSLLDIRNSHGVSGGVVGVGCRAGGAGCGGRYPVVFDGVAHVSRAVGEADVQGIGLSCRRRDFGEEGGGSYSSDFNIILHLKCYISRADPSAEYRSWQQMFRYQ